MIKLVIFDLDGVLYESKEFHFDALNSALEEVDKKFIISKEEHLNVYDGLSTKKKLELLTASKGLDSKFYDQIWFKKQEITNSLLEKIGPNENLNLYLSTLKKADIKLVCCSNSISKTVKTVLKNLGI